MGSNDALLQHNLHTCCREQFVPDCSIYEWHAQKRVTCAAGDLEPVVVHGSKGAAPSILVQPSPEGSYKVI